MLGDFRAESCELHFTSVTASFRVLYVLVAMEIGSRRILHTNVTAHPTSERTVQQFGAFLEFDHPYRFVIYDRDSIFFGSRGDCLERLSMSATCVGRWPNSRGITTAGGHTPL